MTKILQKIKKDKLDEDDTIIGRSADNKFYWISFLSEFPLEAMKKFESGDFKIKEFKES